MENVLSLFAQHGLFAVFAGVLVEQLGAPVPPLAGALGMRTASFAVFNLAGTVLWAGSGIAGGLLFHNQIERLLENLSDLGGIALALVAGLLGLYVAWRVWRRWRRWRLSRALGRLPRVRPDELAELIAQGVELVIVDVRAAALQPAIDKRIPEARHIELATIESVPLDDWPAGAEIITYCSCPNDVSALKAAHLLAKRGLSVRVLRGGIDGWTGAGYPLR